MVTQEDLDKWRVLGASVILSTTGKTPTKVPATVDYVYEGNDNRVYILNKWRGTWFTPNLALTMEFKRYYDPKIH